MQEEHTQLLNGRVSTTSRTTNAMLSSIQGALALWIFYTAVVDKDDRRLLITRRTVRTLIVVRGEDTKRAVPL